MAVYINYYFCFKCRVGWTDVWTCASDDECPICREDISPDEYEVIEEENRLEPE